MKHYLYRINIGLLTLALVGVSALTALAVTRPFHLVEHGTLTTTKDGDNLDLVTDGTGTATHLGRFALHRTATVNLTTGEVEGHATLTAANGDKLESSIKGTLNPQTGKAVLVYEWLPGGTGRFQNASGTTVWLVQVNPPNPDDGTQTYDVVADGIINY